MVGWDESAVREMCVLWIGGGEGAVELWGLAGDCGRFVGMNTSRASGRNVL